MNILVPLNEDHTLPWFAVTSLAIAWFALSGVALMLFSWTTERWLTPKPVSITLRGWRTNLAHALALFSAYTLLLALTSRIGLSAGLSLALVVLLILVNNDKQRTLHEPFLACDFVYFWDAIKHPKFYLPYFGYVKAALLALGFVVLLVLWWIAEPVFANSTPASRLTLCLAASFVSGLIAWRLAQGLVDTASLDPTADLQRLGLVAMLMAYHAAGKRESANLPATPFADLVPINQGGLSTTPAPIILCMQVESFVDFRGSYGECQQPSLPALPAWDSLCAQAVMSGRLTVPAFGANTVRSEFEFLMGVPASALGVHGFEPYQWIARDRSQGLASWLETSLPATLAGCGYQTSFVHPYDRRFYQRDKVLSKLGFDEFIDIKAFDNSVIDTNASAGDRGGYVSDLVLGRLLANKITSLPSDETAFIHAVTMQGHGPYIKGRGPHSVDEIFSGFVACLYDTDQMLGELTQELSRLKRPVVLCVFGDHVPILPEVYDTWGMPDGKTNYVVWRNWPSAPVVQKEIACHELGAHVLAAAGFEGNDKDG